MISTGDENVSLITTVENGGNSGGMNGDELLIQIVALHVLIVIEIQSGN